MRKLILTGVSLTVALTMMQSTAFGRGGPVKDPKLFQHVGTFDVIAGNGSVVSEIVDVTRNGKQLVYTDAVDNSIGFVNISDPANPVGQGKVSLPGEPTSLVIRGILVLVGVNTSPDFVNPSGKLVVVNRITRRIVATHELGGQPDSLALAPDGRRLAIAIENERDESLNNGLLPQLPTGTLLIVDLRGFPWRWKIRAADLSPVADSSETFEGGDLETEYVDINSDNEAVVTFQENNHIAIVDMVTGRTISHFPAGSVALNNVDTVEDDLISYTDSIEKRREPDAVAWIDDDHFATANEGDYEDEFGFEGGSRGFTIFHQDGTVVLESFEDFEHWIGSAGHYNEGRSENKGSEPEAVEVGVYGGGKNGWWYRRNRERTLLFVASERCNTVGVYDATGKDLVPLQLLPTGIGPEGLKAVPQRNLFVVATESPDEAEDVETGIPTMINIYRLEEGPASYPMIASTDDANGTPIPWVALSGMVGDPSDPDVVYAVSDSFLAAGFVYAIDVSAKPAVIFDRIEVTGASTSLDLEGVAIGPDGAFWLASEGRTGTRPNAILKVDSNGNVLQEIPLLADLDNLKRNNGFEGIAVTGTPGSEVVFVAIQRAWPNAGDTDEVNTKIGRYEVATGTWSFVHYPLEAEGGGDWIGLSELTLLPNGLFTVIERDKGWGPTTGFNAELKTLYGIDLASAEFRAFDDPAGLVTIGKVLLRDVLPDLEAVSIWTAEKLEGTAVAADGQLYIVTDNDGVDDATGETLFINLGDWEDALGF